MVKGEVVSMSHKKLNTKISTEAELVGENEVSSLILRNKLFLDAQVYKVKKNILYQDNKSTILLQENGKKLEYK